MSTLALPSERGSLTAGQVARALEIDKATVWRYGERGVLAFRQDTGAKGWRRYRRSDVERLAHTVIDADVED